MVKQRSTPYTQVERRIKFTSFYDSKIIYIYFLNYIQFRSRHFNMVIDGRHIVYTLCILRSLRVRSLSTVGLCRESNMETFNVFAICKAHLYRFEHSGDFSIQSIQCVTVRPVSQVQKSPFYYGDSREGTFSTLFQRHPQTE